MTLHLHPRRRSWLVAGALAAIFAGAVAVLPAQTPAPQGVEGDFEYQFELPDKFRRKESLSMSNQGGVDMLQILNGANASQKIETPETGGAIGGFDGDGGGGRGRGGRGNIGQMAPLLLGGAPVVEGSSPQEQQAAQHTAIGAEMARLLMALLLTTSEPVVWVGTAASPDGTADVLEFKTPDGNPTRLLVDTKTRMPLMLSWTGLSVQLNFGRGTQARRLHSSRAPSPCTCRTTRP
jgi:hypothetical protein